MESIFQFGLQGVVAYGIVGLISTILKRKDVEIDPDIKFYLLVGIAFGVGFVPADMGNLIFNHIKDAVGVAFGIGALNTAVNKLGGNG